MDHDLNKEFTIDKFVYLPLNPYKTPDKTDWSDDEKTIIENKLIIIPAFLEGRPNLINNWLELAEDKSTHVDTKVIIKQYIVVLKNLTIDIMSTTTMKDFYNILKQKYY